MNRIKQAEKQLNITFGGHVTLVDMGHYVRLSGSLPDWDQVVRAGMITAKALKKHKTVVNHIRCEGISMPETQKPSFRDDALQDARPDVLVIGGGIIGCAIARELARYKLDIVLADKEHDLALHASSRNDGMVHPGIDLRHGSLKHKYNLLGNQMHDKLCKELGVPFRRCGQYLCFKNKRARLLLCFSLLYWRWQGIRGVRVLGRRALLAAEPTLSKDISAALFFPSAGSVCPYNLTVALAENAVENGVRVSLDTYVESMEMSEGIIKSVTTNRGTLHPKVIVNAAGVFAGDIAAMAGDEFYSIHPRRGTNAILDSKYADSITKTIVASMGTASVRTTHSKGGGIVRTVEDNILVGPDAVETCEKENFATYRECVTDTLEKQSRTVPALSEKAVITYFTGIRAPTYEEDFVVQMGVNAKNLAHAAGIQSPGISAAPAIACEIARLVTACLARINEMPVRKNESFNPVRMPIVKASRLPDAEREKLIKQNPDYGVIVCRCEEVSAGEIKAALRRPVPCDTVDGVKRRVRPGMGRCQGGFCGPLVAQIISEEMEIPLERVLKSGEGSELVYGTVKSSSYCKGGAE